MDDKQERFVQKKAQLEAKIAESTTSDAAGRLDYQVTSGRMGLTAVRIRVKLRKTADGGGGGVTPLLDS